MHPDRKLSILIMQDGAEVRRYRVSPGRIKFLLSLLVALIMISLTALGVGIVYWNTGYEYKKESIQLKKDLQSTRVQVERLENMQKILEAGGKSITSAALAAITPKSPQANATEEQAKTDQPLDLFELFSSTDTRLAKLENLKAKIASNHIAISFDITNIDSSKQIRGKVRIFVIGRNAIPVEVKGTAEEMNFTIQRYKHFQSNFPLPKSLSETDVFALRVVLNNANGEMIYSETQQLAHLGS